MNMHKSILARSQSITYLGVCFDQKWWSPVPPGAHPISLPDFAGLLRQLFTYMGTPLQSGVQLGRIAQSVSDSQLQCHLYRERLAAILSLCSISDP